MQNFTPPFLPPVLTAKPDVNTSPAFFYAESTYERIQAHIEETQAELQEGQTLSVCVLLTDGSRLTVESFGYRNQGFIIAYGQDALGQNVEALISHTAIQILFVVSVVTIEKPKCRIGFRGGS